MVIIWRFLARSVGFFFLVPPLAGYFRLLFSRFQRDYLFDF
jgi:hypothetical protein